MRFLKTTHHRWINSLYSTKKFLLLLIGIMAGFSANAQNWEQATKVLKTGIDYDGFGWSVAISGDYAIVGAYRDEVSGLSSAGSAYIFARSGDTWVEQVQIYASEPSANDKFGFSVAISNDYAIVGAPYEGVPGISNRGAIYIFKRLGSTWFRSQPKILAKRDRSDELFGYSVAISGDHAIVGNPGQKVTATTKIKVGGAYTLSHYNGFWSVNPLILASDREEGDFFGGSVAISGDYAMIGAPGEDTGGTDAGAVYTFKRSGTSWIQQSKIQANDKQANDSFGCSMAISGNHAIIGAYGEDTKGTDAGAAYIFKRGATWSQYAKAMASDAQAGDGFGRRVAISGDYAIAGAAGEDTGGDNIGAAYIFARTLNWAQQAKIQGKSHLRTYGFGTAVGISGDQAIVGASSRLAYNFKYKQPQTITFDLGSDASKTFGDSKFTLAGSSTSGLTIAYNSSNTNVATVSGNEVTIVGTGTATITASQAGNDNYGVAADIPQTLTVNKANQSITFDLGNNATKTFGGSTFVLAGSATSGLDMAYTSSNTNVATISGNTVTIKGIGTTTITASQAGNDNYNAATKVTQTLTVSKANQSIAFDLGNNTTKIFGDAAFDLTATGGASGNAITYASSDVNVATVSGNTVTIKGVGTTTITASQAGNDNYNAATEVTQTLTVNKIAQTIIFDLGSNATKTFGDGTFDLTATGGASDNTVTYASSDASVATISGTTVTIKGAGTTTITASQAGNVNYDAATEVTQTLTVNKIAQTIIFDLGSNATKTFGDAAFDLTATGGASGNVVTFTSSNTNVATISGNTVTIIGSGTSIITASQVGNNNYNTATEVTQTLTVNGQVTGLAQDLTEGKLTLFPNPVVGNVLYIQVKGKISGTDINISIVNNQGQEVLTLTKQLRNGQLAIPTTSLTAGQYLIKINIGKETIVRRIAKQ